MMYLIVISIITVIFLGYLVLRSRNIHIWIIDYLIRNIRQIFVRPRGPVHIMFCFVDHYEPKWRNSDNLEVERKRVDEWVEKYPAMASGHKDADGCYPKHSFFYPEEEYREEHLAKIKDICDQGFGEIEIHLHHHDDTEESFKQKMSGFIDTLVTKHQALSRNDAGDIGFAFIHGNWALDNSDPRGINCGLNNELLLLKDLGCFVDMTMPSAPNPTQTAKVNSIYMSVDDTEKPKSHNRGADLQVGKEINGDLMILQGPLCLNWNKRKFGIMPGIENGDIRGHMPPTPERIDLWVKQHIHVRNKPEWAFVKIHTHGTQEPDMPVLLGKETDDMFTYLEQHYNDGEKYVLHYVSAREMYNIAVAAAHGRVGSPNEYRDYVYKLLK